ncbi:MAG: class I SAM-dependent methyltransferase [Roseinatronobacter sp.]
MALDQHADLMDRTYRLQRHIYDLTRAWYLLGRDQMIAEMGVQPGAHVLEIACGTGRNLRHIARAYPEARLYGVDISAQMLDTAQSKLGGRAALALGDACALDPVDLFGRRSFDHVILSYSLSMIPDWTRALDQAAQMVAPGGSLHIADFGRQHLLPGWFRRGLNLWLAQFHVTPRHALRDVAFELATNHGLQPEAQDRFGSYAQTLVLRRA